MNKELLNVMSAIKTADQDTKTVSKKKEEKQISKQENKERQIKSRR